MFGIVISGIIGKVGVESLVGEIFLAEMLHYLEYLPVRVVKGRQDLGQRCVAFGFDHELVGTVGRSRLTIQARIKLHAMYDFADHGLLPPGEVSQDILH